MLISSQQGIVFMFAFFIYLIPIMIEWTCCQESSDMSKKIFHFFYFVLYYDWFPIASFCFHKLLYRAVRYRSARHNIHVSISIAGRPIINFNSSCTRTCVERTYLLHHLTLFNYAILLWIKEICKPLNVQNFLSYVFTSVSIWQIRQTDTNILDQYQECLHSFHFPFLR